MTKKEAKKRTSHEAKMQKIIDHFADVMTYQTSTRMTIQEICDGTGLAKNGHTVTAILAVCDQYKKHTVIHHVEISVGGQVRYEIELTNER